MIRECSKCLHNDEYDKEITFSSKGVCNYCTKTSEDLDNVTKNFPLYDSVIQKIKSSKGKNGYDCILGMSGGVDSSYLAHIAKKEELNPLIVHFDNGWNTELSVDNIHKIIEKNKFDLNLLIVDWDEFKDI